MSGGRFVNTGALRELVTRERARLGPLAAGGSVALPLEDLLAVCDELDFARTATAQLAEIAGAAVGFLEVAVAADTIDPERSRIRRVELPALEARLPKGIRRPLQDPKAAHVGRMQTLADERTAAVVAEIVQEGIAASEQRKGGDA